MPSGAAVVIILCYCQHNTYGYCLNYTAGPAWIWEKSVKESFFSAELNFLINQGTNIDENIPEKQLRTDNP